MALVCDYNLGGGVILEDAYHRIERLHLDCPKGYDASVHVTIGVYKDQATRNSGAIQPADHLRFTLAYPSDKEGNVYEQVYELLKGEDYYADAQDA